VSSLANQFTLALQQYQAGNAPAAEQMLHQLLQAAPERAEAHHLLGIIALQAGRYDQAVASLRQALRLNPRAADGYVHLAAAYNGLGLGLEQQGKLEEAMANYREAIRLQPRLAEAHYNLGNVHKREERFDDAIACYQEALRIKPNLPEACNNLGGVRARQGKYEEAIDWYRKALGINPRFADAYNSLGHAYERLKQYDEAICNYKAAVQLNPQCAEAHNGLGCALQRLNKIDEAVECHRLAIKVNPNFAVAHNNLGTTLERQEKLEQALASYKEAMRLRPGYAAARWNRARLWLLLGNFEQGWPEYEGRWTQTDHPRRTFAQPLWDGSDLAGRTIFLHAEQGLGDTLQFIRYAPLVQQRGGRVLVECQPALMNLLSGLKGVDRLLPAGSPLPTFDVQAPLGSLPGIFKTTLETIPKSIPYLGADRKLVQQWKRELRATFCATDVLTPHSARRTPHFLIGIAWQGNPAYGFDPQRSIPLSNFAPLARVDGVRLISLQKKDGTGQLLEFASQFQVRDLGSQLDEANGAFMDTAAIMMNLDLVITSDSALAHLAGALSVPTWIALPLVPDWRWLLRREDSLWYPSVRLFRQTRDGDWADVFERMVKELQSSVEA
jgi:tetratricopeptide (TPR) repeat protein